MCLETIESLLTWTSRSLSTGSVLSYQPKLRLVFIHHVYRHCFLFTLACRKLERFLPPAARNIGDQIPFWIYQTITCPVIMPLMVVTPSSASGAQNKIYNETVQHSTLIKMIMWFGLWIPYRVCFRVHLCNAQSYAPACSEFELDL